MLKFALAFTVPVSEITICVTVELPESRTNANAPPTKKLVLGIVVDEICVPVAVTAMPGVCTVVAPEIATAVEGEILPALTVTSVDGFAISNWKFCPEPAPEPTSTFAYRHICEVPTDIDPVAVALLEEKETPELLNCVAPPGMLDVAQVAAC